MKTGLSEATFTRLLDRLDADRERAGERYEDLRRTLLRFFEWRSAPFPEEHADETLDRVARRLDEGVEIRNLSNYCYTVARLVLMETLKTPDVRRATLELEQLDAPVTLDSDAALAEREMWLVCLETCLSQLPAESRELLAEYYREAPSGKIEVRRALAERLGIRSEALANRLQRVRDKLERSVSACVDRRRDMLEGGRHYVMESDSESKRR